jgi:hypothetical protein
MAAGGAVFVQLDSADHFAADRYDPGERALFAGRDPPQNDEYFRHVPSPTLTSCD